jgi:hypothetical protein
MDVLPGYGQLKFIKELYTIVLFHTKARKERHLAKEKKRRRKEGKLSHQSPEGEVPVRRTWWDKAFVNARNNKGQTPLMLACSKGCAAFHYDHDISCSLRFRTMHVNHRYKSANRGQKRMGLTPVV